VRLAKLSGRKLLRWGLIGGVVSYLIGIPFSLPANLMYNIAGKMTTPRAAAMIYIFSPILIVFLAFTLVWLLGARLLKRPMMGTNRQDNEPESSKS
jgi:hypothetical protein